MPEQHTPTRADGILIVAEIQEKVIDALFGVIKSKDICAECYSDIIMTGMADAFAWLIVETKDASEVGAIANKIAARIVEHVEFLLGQSHHKAGSRHDN